MPTTLLLLLTAAPVDARAMGEVHPIAAVQPPVPSAPSPPAPDPYRFEPDGPARQTGGSISNADYTPAALRAEAEGDVTVAFSINPVGRVTECNILRSSGNSSLDTVTCSLVQRRFRYRPAIRNGRGVASQATHSFAWRLPRD